MGNHRILLISDIADFGGGEANLADHAIRLSKNVSYHPIVVVPEAGLLETHLKQSSIETVRARLRRPHWIAGCIPSFPLQDTLKLFGLIRRLDVDLLHANSFNTALHAGFAGAMRRTPVVWTCRGWDFRSDGIKGRFLNRFVSRIIVTSGWVERKLTAPGVVPKKHTLLVHQGVDVERFAPASSQERHRTRAEIDLGDQDCVLLCVGTIYPLKQQIPLLRCFERLIEIYPDRSLKLVFIGEGSPPMNEFEVALRKEVDSSPARANVRLLGRRWDVERFYSASDILVCPSEVESFGMAVIEAMSSGVPVVSTRCGGPAETVIEGETGFLIDPKSPEEIVDALSKLIADDSRRTAMGKAARERVLRFFDKSNHQKEVENLYDALIESPSIP